VSTDPVVNILGPLDGVRIAGGCAECNAFQVVRAVAALVWEIDVFHDDDCPWVGHDERDDGAR
jgi:hypothetical protein